MTWNPVRMTPYVRHLWRAVPDDERRAIEADVPDGHFLSVIYRTSATDLTVRLYRHRPGEYDELVAMRDHQRDIAKGCRAVLADSRKAVA
jgi:hypothetical protein